MSARLAKRRLREFSAQNLANMAWAFATVGEPVLGMLKPISVLAGIESREPKLWAVCHHMVMECRNRPDGGLLAYLEANELLPDVKDLCPSHIPAHGFLGVVARTTAQPV